MGVPIDTFIERVKASVVWRKLLRTRVLPQVKVAQAEVKDAIERAENSDGKVLVRVAEIFIPYGDESARSKALEKAEELRAKAKTRMPSCSLQNYIREPQPPQLAETWERYK